MTQKQKLNLLSIELIVGPYPKLLSNQICFHLSPTNGKLIQMRNKKNILKIPQFLEWKLPTEHCHSRQRSETPSLHCMGILPCVKIQQVRHMMSRMWFWTSLEVDS